MIQNQTSNEGTIDQLNSFLRGELSAVETYQQALAKLTDFPQRATLENCERSHAERARILAMEVSKRGGEPSSKSGAWGTFAKAVEGSAAAFGAKTAVAALEEGEDHGRDDYARDVEKLDLTARAIIEAQVIPEQLRTHRAISDLKKALS
jgi:demethoxyubiquinone hydroxylase (CLK1/Coq7/Cat5 family)